MAEPRTALEAASLWTELTTHLNQTYRQPDLEALEVFCAAAASHHLKSEAPVWPCIIGPPSTGKTEICIMPFLYDQPHTRIIGDLTPKAFLSGRGGRGGSLLHRCGESSIWLVKDMGTLLSKREQDAKEVFGILREVYDGDFGREVGGVAVKPWHGKITLLGASTPFLDRHYEFINELGDRLLFVRWNRGNAIEQGRTAIKRIGYSVVAKQRSQDLVKAFVHQAIQSIPPSLPP